MLPDRLRILDSAGVETILKRMAFQVYEHNYGANGIVLVGVDARGSFLAEKLVGYLNQISNLEVDLMPVWLDRGSKSKLLGMEIEGELEELRGRVVVIVDDVLYTGITLANVVAIILQAEPEQIQSAILIDRGHRIIPVAADFVGKELATTLHQHVAFEVNEDQTIAEVFLT